jgi:hypothetical protein
VSRFGLAAERTGAANPKSRSTLWFADSSSLHVVVLMSTNPVPQDSLCRLDSDSAIVVAYTDGPMTTNVLEVQRWVTWVSLQQGEVLIRQLLDLGGEPVVVLPEVGMTDDS